MRAALAPAGLVLVLLSGPGLAAADGPDGGAKPAVEASTPKGTGTFEMSIDDHASPLAPRQRVRTRISVRADIERVSPAGWLAQFGEVEERPATRP